MLIEKIEIEKKTYIKKKQQKSTIKVNNALWDN